MKNRIINLLPISPLDMVSVNDDMWFSATGFNGLCRFNSQSGETEFVGCFLEEDTDRMYLHSQVGCFQNILIFSPNFSNGIDIYDIEKKEFDRIPIPEEIYRGYGKNNTKTFAMQQIKNKFIIFGFFCPVIFFVDSQTRELKIVQNMHEKLYGSLYDRSKPVFKRSSCLVGEKVFILCAQSMGILEVNLLSQLYTYIETEIQYDTICHDGLSFWLSAKNKLYKMQNYEYENVFTVEGNMQFILSRFYNNCIYYFSHNEDKVIVFNNRNSAGSIEKLGLEFDDNIIEIDDGCNKLSYNDICKSAQGELILICNKSNTFGIVRQGKVEKKQLLFQIEIPQLEEIINKFIVKEKISLKLYEKNINLWIAYLLSCKNKACDCSKKEICIGEQIHHAITN